MKIGSSVSVASIPMVLILTIVSFAFVPVAHATGGLFSCTTGPLIGSNETPPNGSPATGTVVLTVDTSSNTVQFTLTFSGLSGPSTASHIHQAPAGVAGSVKVPLPLGAALGATSGTASGTASPSAGFNVADIIGNPTGFYVNLHSTVFPGGEIRGQLISCTLLSAIPEFPIGLTSVALVAVLLPLIIALRRRSLVSL